MVRDSLRRWILMALLVVAMISCYAHRGALGVAAPFMIRDHRLSPAVMGILLSAFFWSYALMQVPAGWLVDRFGVRWSYGAGYALWSIATVLTGLTRGFAALIASRVLLGIGQATAFPASARAVSNWYEDRTRGIVSAGYLTGVRLGQAMVSAAGAFFLAAYGFKAFFVGLGIISMLWLPPWFSYLRRLEGVDSVPGTPPRQTRSRAGATFLQSLALFKHRSVLGIFLGFFAYDYAWFVYVNWLPGYLVLERKFTTAEMGIFSSVPYLAMSIVILLSGFVSDALVRRGIRETTARKTLIVIGLLFGCLIVPAGLVASRVAAVWLLTISLCGLGIATPNTWTLTQAVCSKRIVGTVSGIQNFGGNLGGILAPALTGYIAHITSSFAIALGITGGILVFGIFCYGLLVKDRVDPS